MLRRRILYAVGAALLWAAPALAALTANPTAVDFGPVDPAGAPFTLSVAVTNTGAADDVIGSVNLTDAGTANEFSLVSVTDSLGAPLTYPYTLTPGASFNIAVSFTPSSSTAGTSYFGGVTVFDGLGGVLLDLPLSGSVAHTGSLVPSATAVSFGPVPAGTVTTARIVTIDNQTTATVTFDSVEIDDGGAGDFQVTVPTVPFDAAPSAQFEIRVIFAPTSTVPGTAYTGYVTLFYLFNNEPRWITIDFTGSVAADTGGGGGGGTTEPGLSENNDGLFIGPCFLGALAN
jgi:hypothetical protein